MKKLVITSAIVIAVFCLIISIMVSIPPPKSIPVLESISAPFRKVDFTNVPGIDYYIARNGSKLAYRTYFTQNAKHTIVLIHGSSGSSLSMHPLAKFLQKQGMTVYAIDIRGHGNSGRKGDIEYIGQLEDDMEDFANQVLKDRTTTLVGFSQGGGFVLRFAAGTRSPLFDRYILLSPYIGYNAPVLKPASSSWAAVSYPRIISISLLGYLGEKLFGSLPVITFAIDPLSARYQTVQYSFRLLNNFNVHSNYKADIASVKQPLMVLVGEKDELFKAYAYKPLFDEIRQGTKVIIVRDVGHVTLTTSTAGISAISNAIVLFQK